MNLVSFSSTSVASEAVIEDIVKSLGQEPPDLILLYMTVTMPMEKIFHLLSKKYPTTKIAGSTSCSGIMTQEGFKSDHLRGVGGMAFYSHKGDYGIGFAPQEKDTINVVEACERSLASADKSGILPKLVWMIASPGLEEYCLKQMNNFFGMFVPVFGGSAADNDISGKWKLFIDGEIHDSGLIIVSFFDIPLPHYSFHCGYQQTGLSGKVTRSKGRELLEIDGRSSADVYNEWTDGLLTKQLVNLKGEKNQSILSLSSLHPLARVKGEVGSLPYYLLSHPESVTTKKTINLFTDIQDGEEVFLMEGSIESLQLRASEVVKTILNRERISQDNIAGALVVFCAGCMLTISSVSSMQPVAEGIKASLGNKPFLGVFSFGEQGCFFEDSNFHGNLMISVTIFTKV